MNVFKEITAVLGWLSGSLAGIAAVFFACGYLIKRAHLNLLGISALFSFTEEQYMQEGARFVAEMADLLARIALPLLMLAIMVVAAGFLLLRTGLRRRLDPVKERLTRFIECRGPECRSAGYGLLLVLLVLLIDREISLFGAPLAVSDLLFAPSVAAGGDAGRIREWLVAGDRTSLDNLYFNLTLSVIKAGVLLLLAWRVVEQWRLRILLTAPFALAFLLSVLLLPMSYGVLKRPARFPRITVDSESGMLASVRGELYLLDKTGEEFVLWEAATRRVLWVPRDEVKSAEIGQARFLFGNGGKTP
ncbi:MAG: hypothetical protein A2075_05645 [Geobacteraceae bacterium GWC2_58_44]|nr:MAG: hypothetical protein A2075_05645 [Geobacteraceae bacterium GWC2_58_44]HBG06390.1 hypothetical protein [Geobacter sp.]